MAQVEPGGESNLVDLVLVGEHLVVVVASRVAFYIVNEFEGLFPKEGPLISAVRAPESSKEHSVLGLEVFGKVDCLGC